MASRKISAYGKIKDGKLIIEHRQYFDMLLSEFEEGDVSITISQVKNTRSAKMNRYYFGVVIASLVKYFNEEMTFGDKVDAETVHEIFKVKYLNKGTATMPDGQILQLSATTTSLSNTEFIEYWENVIAWAAQYVGVIIPLPNEDFRE